jgi:hypothetical protein
MKKNASVFGKRPWQGIAIGVAAGVIFSILSNIVLRFIYNRNSMSGDMNMFYFPSPVLIIQPLSPLMGQWTVLYRVSAPFRHKKMENPKALADLDQLS